MVDLSQAGVNALRLKNSQAAASGCQAVQAELGSRVEDGEMGGVSVEWITPHQVDGPEVVLYLFGGAFVCGSPEDDVSISARLAHHLGRRVCAPRYRLAPEHPFPAARDDAMAVYRALTAADSRVILCGESAGGNLALGLVIGIAEADLAPPLSVALLSPWIDLSHSGDSHTALDGLDPTLSVELFLSPASQAYAREHAPASPAISPLFAALPANMPPTVISSATRDLLLSDSVRLAARLRAAGAAVDLRVADGLWHVFEWYPELPEAAESVRGIASFLSSHLACRW